MRFLRLLHAAALTVSMLGLVAYVACIGTPVAQAQADLGSVSGTVIDASGAVVPNASITLVNAATGAQRVSVTNSQGDYSITQLPPADYQITVAAAGFTSSHQNFTLAIGSTRAIHVRLGVSGGQTEIVVTTDNTTTPDVVDAQISTEITSNQVENMPLADRNPYSLVNLSGNVSGQISGGDRGVGVDIGGARSASVDILMDGAENTDLFGVGVGQSIPQDAMQEFSVVVAGQGAEFGRASGGAVNVGTKGGTNKFHGDLYEYNRVSTFASDTFQNNAYWAAPDHNGLSSPKPRYVHNQFGYFVGGPIKQNKMFFSSATEWTRIRSSLFSTAEVPLPGLISMSASNMQGFFSSYGTLQYPVNSQTYTGAQTQKLGLWASDITAIAKNQTAATGASCSDAALADAPICTTPLFGTVIYPVAGDSGGGTPVNQWINFDRVDWTISDRTQIFGRYVQQSSNFFPGTNASSPYKGYNTGSTQVNHNLLLSLTHTFSQSVASATKVLATRFNNLQPLNGDPVPTLYPNSSATVGLGQGTINFPGYLPTSPGAAIPFGGPQNFIQIGEDLTWSKGKHTFKFGGEYLFIKDNRVFGAYEEAVDALVTSGTKGGLVNFVAGNIGYENVAIDPKGAYPCKRDPATNAYIKPYPSDCLIQTPASAPNFSRSNRFHDGAAYFTDSWHASPRLTVNAGMRWEMYGPQHSQKASYDSNFFFGAGSTIYDKIRNGGLQTRQTAPNGRMWKLNLKQFGPRLGVAYDLSGNGKSVIRAGFALSYERNFNNVTFNVIQNPPNYAVVALNDVPITTANLGAFADNRGLVPLPNTTLRGIDPNIKPVYSQNWNLTIEHQLDPTTMVTAGYIGSRGIHLYSIANINRQYAGANYLGDASGVSRLNLQFGSINFRGSDADSYYHAVNFGIRSTNMHHTGLSSLVNYTFGKSTDNNSSTFGDGLNGASGYLGYLDPFNHALDRGPSDFDTRQRVTAGLVWEMPFLQHSVGVEKALLGGWVASTTFTAQTGNPYSIYDCGSAYNVCPRAAFTGARPKKLKNLRDISADWGPNTYSYQDLPDYTDSNYNLWVNPNFGISDMPLVGSAGSGEGGFAKGMDTRNAYYGPGIWGEDLKVSKNFAIREHYGINLSGTAINAFNHANTYLNLNGYNDVSYVTQTLAYKNGHRDMEFEAKFVF